MAVVQDGTDDAALWAGVIEATCAMVVYDPTLQLPGTTEINVYSVARGLVRRFDPVWLRGKAKTVWGPQRASALAEYATWKRLNGDEFMRDDVARADRESSRPGGLSSGTANYIAATASAIERHREFISQSGVEYVGTTNVGLPNHRVTHCWRCKSHLDNEINVSCAACRWILCACGACGCGRPTRST